MHLPVWPRFYSLQLPHRPQYPLPHRIAIQVALIEHGVLDWRVLAVALHEDLGGSFSGGQPITPLDSPKMIRSTQLCE